MADTSSQCLDAARQLGDLLAQLPISDEKETWNKVEATAQGLGNDLRVRNEETHTALGRTLLPQTLTSLLKYGAGDASKSNAAHMAAVVEILRIGANLCMDHDENRGHLLEAGFPQETVSLLEGYAGAIPEDAKTLHEPLDLSVLSLKVIKTCIGVLLNSTIGYEPVRSRLASLEAPMTLLRLSGSIYPPGSWASAPAALSTSEEDLESWMLRSTIINWTWRTIEELKVDGQTFLEPDALPLLTPILLAFIPPYSAILSNSLFTNSSPARTSLIRTDFDFLEESCTLLESLALDVEDVRLSLARGMLFPAEHGGVACLSNILDFIEKGAYSPLWSINLDATSVAQMQKTFDICKAALIKAVVEVAGEDKNEDVLWDETEESQPGGAFVCRMVDWIKNYANNPGRGDLVICASLSLGNLAKRETTSTALLSPPHSIAPLLSSDAMLGRATDIKVKHGVIGLLKHLSQSSSNSPKNRTALADSGVIERLVISEIWGEKGDAMAEVVQMGAIGVVKHLCNGSADNSCDLVLPPKGSMSPAGLAQIVALVRRSDTVAIKSEGTRVLVNVIKSLWSNDKTTEPAQLTKRQQAIKAVLVSTSGQSLASLVGRSMKYPALINEGVVAMSLLSMTKEGASLVLNAIAAPLPVEAIQVQAPSTNAVISASASASSDADSPVVTSPTSRTKLPIPLPRCALDRLMTVLKNTPPTDGHADEQKPITYPLEVRANVCLLLGQVGRQTSRGQQETVQEVAKGTLEDLAKTFGDGRESLLGTAAKKALDNWAGAQAK